MKAEVSNYTVSQALLPSIPHKRFHFLDLMLTPALFSQLNHWYASSFRGGCLLCFSTTKARKLLVCAHERCNRNISANRKSNPSLKNGNLSVVGTYLLVITRYNFALLLFSKKILFKPSNSHKYIYRYVGKSAWWEKFNFETKFLANWQ